MSIFAICILLPIQMIIIIIMSLTPVSSSDEDIGGVPFIAIKLFCQIWSDEVYAWKRGVQLSVRRSKSEETLSNLLITIGGWDFWFTKVFSETTWNQLMNLKSGYLEGETAKWKVMQRKVIYGTISDRISGTISKIQVGTSKRSWRNVWCNQNHKCMLVVGTLKL